MSKAEKIGIDVGGTKIAAIVLGPDDTVLFEDRLPTPKNDYQGVLAAISTLVARARRVTGPHAQVGLGIPGSVSPATGVVQNANSTWMNNRDFHTDIERRLGQPVKIANDANCLALSEARDGAGKGKEVVFAVIIGTGCGGAVVVNNKLLTGRHAIAGEWGHTPLPWARATETPGPQCWCGQKGCLELWVSGSGMERDFTAKTGKYLTAADIHTLAADGQPACQSVLENHTDRLARGLALISNIIDPDVIILGGGLSNMPHLYRDLPARMAPYIFADHFKTAIRPAVHGDASGVRGAARLWETGNG